MLGIKKIFNVDQINDVRQKILTTFKEKVPFLIGPYSSETSYIGSILTGTFSQITISYGATYSDFDASDHNHENMLRTVPSDKFRIQVSNFISVATSSLILLNLTQVEFKKTNKYYFLKM